MQYFYIEERHSEWYLADGEEHHCYKVLRHTTGDRVQAVDGLGTRFEIALQGPRHPIQILSQAPDTAEQYPEVVVLFPLLKKADRLSYLVEKATELGATSLIPLYTARCERKEVKVERLLKVIVAAMKQCGRSRMPVLQEQATLASLDATRLPSQKFIPHLEAEHALADQLGEGLSAGVCFAIGPEGDFTPQEVQQALAMGFQPCLLGKHRLRAETAVAHVLSIAKMKIGY